MKLESCGYMEKVGQHYKSWRYYRLADGKPAHLEAYMTREEVEKMGMDRARDFVIEEMDLAETVFKREHGIE